MLRPLFAALLLLPLAAPVRAAPYTALYAFGDSLPDVGNVFTATGGALPAPPYADGQFSNGPVWVQGLASALGVAPLRPSLQGGTNYAYGGAQSGTTAVHAANPTDLTGAAGQIAQYLAATPTSDPGALYTIWVGSNDLRSIGGANLPSAQVGAALGQVVANVDGAIAALAADGARNVLVVTVPDLGLTPAARAGGPAAQAGATALAAGFNSLLRSGGGPLLSLGALAAQFGIRLSVLDSFALLDQAAANPAAFGFTNVTDPCLVGAAVCAPTRAGQNQHLFWDDLHPTAAGHALIAQAALAALDVPEPGSLALLATGLALAAARRRGYTLTTKRR